MCVCARLLLLAALPALAGRASWCADGEVVSVMEGGGEGAGPAFAPRQRATAVAAVGQAATLDCRVLRLGDKSVSWVRSSDLQILTHAGAVFTADARVSAAETRAGGGGAAGTRHSLRIERLRVADGGRYECQVNTEPKMSLFFNLTVLDEPVPSVVVSAVGGRVVRGARGAEATLACEARYEPPPRDLPLPPLDIRWRRAGAGATSQLSLQRSRGGISLDTERWAARVVSRLTLAELRAADAGAYECVAGAAGGADAGADAGVGGGEQTARTAALRLVVTDQEEHMEMQRDQSASGARGAAGAGGAGRAAGGGGALLPALTTLVALLAMG